LLPYTLRGLARLIVSAAESDERVDEQTAQEQEDRVDHAVDKNGEPGDRLRR